MLEDYHPTFINNADVYDDKEDKYLNEEEIKFLNIYISPVNGKVYRFIDGKMVRDNRYIYSSY